MTKDILIVASAERKKGGPYFLYIFRIRFRYFF